MDGDRCASVNWGAGRTWDSPRPAGVVYLGRSSHVPHAPIQYGEYLHTYLGDVPRQVGTKGSPRLARFPGLVWKRGQRREGQGVGVG